MAEASNVIFQDNLAERFVRPAADENSVFGARLQLLLNTSPPVVPDQHGLICY